MSQNKRLVRRRILSTILMAIAFMWLMPFASFSLREPGFYISIASAILIDIGTWMLIKKYHTKEDH